MHRDPRGFERSNEIRSEMQARGRRGDGARFVGEQGLVIAVVARVLAALACDIRRQRHVAETADGVVERRSGKREGQHDLAAVFLDHVGVETCEQARHALGRLAKADAVADRQPFAGSREGAPAVLALALVQRDFDARDVVAARANAIEASGNDAGVVDDECVAGAQPGR
jgi:hypothetical protein